MASTLTRTAAAFAVASLPLIAGASVSQASDSSPKRDFCKETYKKDNCEPRRGESKPEYKHKERDNKDYTRPTPRKTYEPKHEESHGERYDKTRHHKNDDDHTYKKRHHHKDDDHKWEKKRHHKKDDHRKHDRRHHHKKHVKYDPLNEVRTATAKYFSVAAAERDGYHRAASGPLRGCITETPGKNSPAMGFHWMNASLMDTTVELTKPEALVYEPNSLGKLDLVAVEYVVPKAAWDAKHINPPKLFGLDYESVSIPGVAPFYALHAWVWKFNPDGTHAAFNPLASCKYASLLPK
jgi:hypothetical protein